MMPNVTRGDRMAGLLTYLAGPGRANEHTDPHLVAGDDFLMAWHSDGELGRDGALAIAHHLDQPRTAYGVEVDGGHVWHCSLSIRADEGTLSDEKWQAIARDFVTAMGFDDNEGTKAPCRWVAVRHGLSGGGNDHVHLAVNLVREDGTKASTHRDYKRAQDAARALEVKHELVVLESATAERGTRGYHPAEREAQATARARAKHERGRTQQCSHAPAWEHLSAQDRKARVGTEMTADEPRYLLAIKARGCATASRSEAEYVRRLRRSDLLVRPRFADGRTDVVTGYSLAQRPQAGERPIWYGGGSLARDLALPRLRTGWEDTPTGATEAAAEWNAAKRGRRVVAPGRETTEFTPDHDLRQSERLASMVDRLAAVPVHDHQTWATVAHQTAGALAAWSNASEPAPGELAAAADALSRSAQTYKRTPPPTKTGTVAISGSAMLLASAMRGGQGSVGQAAMVRELIALTEALVRVAQAARQDRYARENLESARATLARVRERMPAPPQRATPAPVLAGVRAATAITTAEVQGKPRPVASAANLTEDQRKALEQMNATRGRSVNDIGRIVPSKLEPHQRPAHHAAGPAEREGPGR